MSSDVPIHDLGWFIKCYDANGNKKAFEFYTEKDDEEKTLEKYKKSLENQGFTIYKTTEILYA